jgi:cation-transporting ATPase 13A3/4/5
VHEITRERAGDEYVMCRPKAKVDDDITPCTDNTSLFLISSFQYLIACACFSVSKPFRASILTNPFYVVAFLTMAIFQGFLVL